MDKLFDFLMNIAVCIVALGGMASLLLLGLGIVKVVRWLRGETFDVGEYSALDEAKWRHRTRR